MYCNLFLFWLKYKLCFLYLIKFKSDKRMGKTCWVICFEFTFYGWLLFCIWTTFFVYKIPLKVCINEIAVSSESFVHKDDEENVGSIPTRKIDLSIKIYYDVELRYLKCNIFISNDGVLWHKLLCLLSYMREVNTNVYYKS